LLTGQRVDQKSITTASELFNKAESFTCLPLESARSNSMTGAPIFAASPSAHTEPETAEPKEAKREQTIRTREHLLVNFAEITRTSGVLGVREL
jgi:hypothetical protein